MKKGDVVFGGLVPAYQDAPETVQPTVRAFHHPAPGLVPGLPLDCLSLLPATAYVGGEAEFLQGAAHLGEVAAPASSTGQAFVQAHPLGMPRAGRRPVHRHAVHRGPHQLHVVAVGPVHRQTHRNARRFSQQAALDAPFASVGGIGAGSPPPRPGEIWSWRRPCSANSSPTPSVRHSVPVPPAITPGILLRRPTAESAGGRWTRSRCLWRPTLSTGSRCAVHRRCRWRKCGREPGAGRRRTDGCSHAGGSAAPAPPRVSRKSGNRRWWDWSWWLGQSASDVATWSLSLWSWPKSRRNPSLPPRNGTASFHQLLG